MVRLRAELSDKVLVRFAIKPAVLGAQPLKDAKVAWLWLHESIRPKNEKYGDAWHIPMLCSDGVTPGQILPC